jgi:hypothetical protein
MEDMIQLVSLLGKGLEWKGRKLLSEQGLQRDCKADILFIQRTFSLKRQVETVGGALRLSSQC